jgi:hypothetical protein
MFTFWNPVQACAWIASKDDDLAAGLADRTFSWLAFNVELELIEADPHAAVIEAELIDHRLYFKPRKVPPQKADKLGTAWVRSAQEVLLAACRHDALKMTGR